MDELWLFLVHKASQTLEVDLKNNLRSGPVYLKRQKGGYGAFKESINTAKTKSIYKEKTGGRGF